MTANMLEGSWTVNMVKAFLSRYEAFAKMIIILTKESTVSKKLFSIQDSLKVAFNGSFIRKITDPRKGGAAFFYNSTSIEVGSAFFLRLARKAKMYFDYSKNELALGRIRHEPAEAIFRYINSVFLTALITNTVIAVLCRADISLAGWLLRATFLSLSFYVMFAPIRWDEIRRGSILIGYFTKGWK